jgi:peptidoglycan DL-endopeptidase CwlO
MPGRHAATTGPLSLPLSLSGSSSLTRTGIAAALVTASAAAVAGSTGMFASAGSDVAPAAATATLTAYSPAAAVPAPRAPVVTPVAAAAPVAKAAPATRTKAPAKKAATPTKAKAKAVPTKAAAPAAAAGSLGTRIVSKAASFEGTPYVYGATGPSSFDCSGLTSYVFKKMGISIPRTAQQQYDAAQHLSKSQAQPGDLIFMGSPSNIYHVAIYAGNGKIWTAPEPGESVKLGNLWGNWHVGRIR